MLKNFQAVVASKPHKRILFLVQDGRAEQLVAEVRTALKDYAAMDQLRTLASDLEQMVHSLNATASRGARLLREEMTDDETVNRSQLHQVLSWDAYHRRERPNCKGRRCAESVSHRHGRRPHQGTPCD